MDALEWTCVFYITNASFFINGIFSSASDSFEQRNTQTCNFKRNFLDISPPFLEKMPEKHNTKNTIFNQSGCDKALWQGEGEHLNMPKKLYFLCFAAFPFSCRRFTARCHGDCLYRSVEHITFIRQVAEVECFAGNLPKFRLLWPLIEAPPTLTVTPIFR